MLPESREAIVNQSNPAKVMLACTGTGEKYLSLLDVVHQSKKSAGGVPVNSVWQLTEAGLVPEPVTDDPNYLIFAKQKGHRGQLAQKLGVNSIWREELTGQRIVTAANDVDTTVGSRPLTKTVLQKERGLCNDDYPRLIHASLLWLLAEINGLLGARKHSWKDITSDLDELREFDDKAHDLFEPDTQYVLPIKFQSVDAFEVLDVKRGYCGGLKLERVGPAVAVLHKSYASITLATDHRGEIPKLINAIQHYEWVTTKSFEKGRYDLNRCPLAIYWSALFNSLVVNDIGVVLNNVGGQPDGVNLTDLHGHLKATNASPESLELLYKTKEEELNRLELRQNGYNPESVAIAMEVFGGNVGKRTDNVLFVECKPGQRPIHKWEKRPRELN